MAVSLERIHDEFFLLFAFLFRFTGIPKSSYDVCHYHSSQKEKRKRGGDGKMRV